MFAERLLCATLCEILRMQWQTSSLAQGLSPYSLYLAKAGNLTPPEHCDLLSGSLLAMLVVAERSKARKAQSLGAAIHFTAYR
jgi:hypothetical protein